MKLVITIDTEEDNWANYSRMDNPVENIERLVPLQELFDRYGAKPTYLISYPVATNPRSVEILKSIHDQGKCEIGSHCHPWNTPPFEEEINNYNSMLCNLPEDLQYKKLKTLHETIIENFGIAPVSFRAGRWGFSTGVARSLVRLGYRVDSSVSPFIDWVHYQGPDYSLFDPMPFRFSPEELKSKPDGELLQIPASIGFLQGNFQFCQRLSEFLNKKIYRMARIPGILRRLNLLNKVWLSPENIDAKTMIKLAGRLEVLNYPYLNMTFHSTSLLAGLSPFVTTAGDETHFLKQIATVLEHAAEMSWESVTLAQTETSKLFNS